MGKKLQQATHKGILNLAGFEIPCYVLEDGRRVLYQRGLVSALGMSRGASSKGRGDRLAIFMSGKKLQPYISQQLLEVTTTPFDFITDRGTQAYGYEATILVDICDAVIEARNSGVLQKQQLHIAARCEALLRSFAKVGIIALVDEATGYQRDRNREELQKLLGLYISESLLPWAKCFPDEFYDEIFRLRNWQWTSAKSKRPRLVGKLTNKIVYKRLPPGVLEELKQKNPVVSNGRRNYKHFQFLTDDIGNPHLRNHLIAVTALMKASTTWGNFTRLLERAFPLPGTQGELFDETDDAN